MQTCNHGAEWYILTSPDDGVSVNLIFDSWVIAMQITNRLTQSSYHYENHDYGISCSSRVFAYAPSVSAPIISVRIQLEPSSTHHEERQNRPEKAQRDPGCSTPSCLLPSSLVPSSYRARFCLSRGGGRPRPRSRTAKLNKTICSKANNGIRFTCE